MPVDEVEPADSRPDPLRGLLRLVERERTERLAAVILRSLGIGERRFFLERVGDTARGKLPGHSG